ncbi:hypothetical protein SXIM_01310 [Streptomyces xiamenensis]|uniref:Uncharacterized protein n=1 Tax=Streptomyces xiamenensis TaxID=408015 RepID=A0A0F7FQ17_9ACTN|nr:hypothetical protein SXIM_01310 [Streptomyces xiamenensis]
MHDIPESVRAELGNLPSLTARTRQNQRVFPGHHRNSPARAENHR